MNNEKITETYDVLKTFIPKEDIYLNEPMSKHRRKCRYIR